MTTPDNRNIERESREIDRRLRQARKHGNLPDVDWLFLRAFLGALENELDAVDAFLAAGGDRDRSVIFECFMRSIAIDVYSLIYW